jgi:Kef-type K+ transport system membrane component KefB/mannitol/fructose-specific phosphotransferase system IIA component (Ntr-type)
MTLTLAASLLSTHELLILFLSLAILLGVARLLGEISRYFGQPALLGELLAGVLLGPTLFDYISPSFHEWLFPKEGGAAIALHGFGQLSVALLLLVAGLEVDLSSVWRQGKAALWVSVTGVALPFVLGCGIALLLPGLMGKEPQGALIPFAAFIGIAMSITALPVISRVLMDLNLFKSDMGMLIMSAAMINDLVGWIGFAFVLAMMSGVHAAETGGTGGQVLTSMLLTMVFVVGILTLGRWLFHKALPLVQARTVWPSGVISFVLVASLAGGALTEWIGIHTIFGAFLTGVALGDSPHLRERTRDVIHQFVISIFAPVFFALLAIQTNFIKAFDPLLVLVVLVVAIFAKVSGCYMGATWAGMNKRESLATAFGMTARGAMEMVLADLARNAGLITDELFVAILIMALITSLISGPMMQYILGRKKSLKLLDVLAEKHILLNLKAHTVREVIDEMATKAAAATDMTPDDIAATVWQREQLMHTGLPHQMAVPHGRLPKLPRPIILLGRSSEGIDFDSPDGQSAQLIFMLLTPLQDNGAQLELLSMIGRTFDNPQTRNQVLAAKSVTEILAAINQASSDPHNH